jgi:hypothetical protein
MPHNKIKIAIAIACLAVILFSCEDRVIHTGHTEESQKYKFSEFTKNIETFPYEASADKRIKVLDGFAKLLLGMDKKEANALLGEPDAEFFSYDTTKGNKTFSGSSWGYYLHRHEEVYAKEQYDQTLFLYFDLNNKLYWANPHNIDTIEVIGGPHLKKR